MMIIQTNINFAADNALIETKVSRLYFPIYFDFGGDRAFPSTDWEDFGVILFTWWCDAYFALGSQQGKCLTSFMDGPFRLELEKIGERLSIVCFKDLANGDREVRDSRYVERHEFLSALLTVGNLIESSLAGMKIIKDKDFLEFETAIKRIRDVQRG